MTTVYVTSIEEVITVQPGSIEDAQPGLASEINVIPILDAPIIHSDGKACYCFEFFKCCCYDLCRMDCVSDLDLYEAITRYEEEFVLSVDEFIHKISRNKYLLTILESLYKSYPEFFFTYLPTGSLREGFGKVIPSTSVLATDYDIMLVPDAVTVGRSGAPYGKKTSVFTAFNAPHSELAGYLWLKLEDEYLSQWEKLCLRRHLDDVGCSLLSSRKLRDLIKDTIKETVALSDLTQKFYNTKKNDVQVLVTNNGPALTVEVKGDRVKYFHADFTLGLHCVEWPEIAEGFFTSSFRENWPSQEAVSTIKSKGCHVVPKTKSEFLVKLSLNQEENTTFGTSPGLEWRYSFSQPEIILSTNIPSPAKTAFLAFKALVKRHLNQPSSSVSSYALKCILYRVVESYPSSHWNARKRVVVETFEDMLEELFQNLNQKNCPNYWIPEINLFEKLTELDYKRMLQKITKINQKPQEYVADNWLEHTRWLRKNCCYNGEGYKQPISSVQTVKEDTDGHLCYCGPCDSNYDCCPGSEEFKYDPLALDVY